MMIAETERWGFLQGTILDTYWILDLVIQFAEVILLAGNTSNLIKNTRNKISCQSGI